MPASDRLDALIAAMLAVQAGVFFASSIVAFVQWRTALGVASIVACVLCLAGVVGLFFLCAMRHPPGADEEARRPPDSMMIEEQRPDEEDEAEQRRGLLREPLLFSWRDG